MIFSRGCNKQVAIPMHLQSHTKYKEKHTLFPNTIGETGQLRVYSCTTQRGFSRYEEPPRLVLCVVQSSIELLIKSQKKASTEAASVSGPHRQPGGQMAHSVILFGI